MLHNHLVYKGYRLSANVERSIAQGDGTLSAATFRATLTIMPASGQDSGLWPEDAIVSSPLSSTAWTSPRDAIQAAMEYGCQIVDQLPSLRKPAAQAFGPREAKPTEL